MKYFKRIIGSNHKSLESKVWKKLLEIYEFEHSSNPVTKIKEKYPNKDNFMITSLN